MANTCFTQLEVWKVAHALTLDVYRMVRSFPRSERFELASQMRRASLSIPANIAEGFGRMSPRDKARHYAIAKASGEELRYFFILSRDLGYIDVRTHMDRLDSVCRMPRRLIDVTLSKT